MKWNDLFENWKINKIKLNFKFAQLEFEPNPEDEIAAWEMYVELITRITTQRLKPEHGDEKVALESIYSLFSITRIILKKDGRKCKEFAKLAIIILNQLIRPFTAKWHRLSLEGAFGNSDLCNKFREELYDLQTNLRQYTKLLAHISKVEDLTDLDETE